jgi:very-short-patch-repair endonuclease
LIVELDGYAYHRTRKSFERDRRRDAALLTAGYRTLRVTAFASTTSRRRSSRSWGLS